MSYDWCEFLDLALALQGDAPQSAVPDAALRSAISRAYYACFCSAREYVNAQPGAPSLPSDAAAHSRLANYLVQVGKQTGDSIPIVLGSTLRRLRMQRNAADYEDLLPRLPDETRTAINRARAILGHLQHLGWSR